MKRTTVFLGVSALILTVGTALADGKRGKMFDRVDTNKDGRITSAEAAAFGADRFERIDENGNGTVTLDEMRTHSRKRAADRVAKRFEKLDGNGDGVVDRAEFDQMGAQRFARMDRDGDGTVTREELREARKDRRQRKGG